MCSTLICCFNNKYSPIVVMISNMCNIIYERYLLAKMYFTKFKD